MFKLIFSQEFHTKKAISPFNMVSNGLPFQIFIRIQQICTVLYISVTNRTEITNNSKTHSSTKVLSPHIDTGDNLGNKITKRIL